MDLNGHTAGTTQFGAILRHIQQLTRRKLLDARYQRVWHLRQLECGILGSKSWHTGCIVGSYSVACILGSWSWQSIHRGSSAIFTRLPREMVIVTRKITGPCLPHPLLVFTLLFRLAAL